MKKQKNKNKHKKRNYLEIQKESEVIHYSEIHKDINKPLSISKNLKINYNLNIIDKYEKNNISNSVNIEKPNINKIKELLSSINNSELIVFENSNNKIVEKDIIFIRKIEPDGNCYYRVLSYFLTKNQNYYNYFRNYIYNYLTCNKNLYEQEYPFIIYNDEINNFEIYINKIRQNGFFAGELEIMISSKILNINIIVFKYKEKYNGYIQQCKFIYNNSIAPIMFVEHTGGYYNGHYNIIHIKNINNVMNYIKDIPFVINNKYNSEFL